MNGDEKPETLNGEITVGGMWWDMPGRGGFGARLQTSFDGIQATEKGTDL